MVQWDWRCLGSAGSQVRSSDPHRGSRIRRCCSCSLGCDCGSDLIPDPETPYAVGQPTMKKKKKSQEVKTQRGTVAFPRAHRRLKQSGSKNQGLKPGPVASPSTKSQGGCFYLTLPLQAWPSPPGTGRVQLPVHSALSA